MTDARADTSPEVPSPVFGARIINCEAVFRVWAPAAETLFLDIDGEAPRPMTALPGGDLNSRAGAAAAALSLPPA